MNKTLKWILIGLGIAIAAFLVTMAFFGFHRGGYSMMNGIDDYGRGLRTFGRMPMMGFMPMMAFGLLRGVFGLGVFALAVIGVVLLIRNGKSKQAQKMAAAQPAVSETPVVAPEPEINCKKCGKVLQKDWAVCPYCGRRQ